MSVGVVSRIVSWFSPSVGRDVQYFPFSRPILTFTSGVLAYRRPLTGSFSSADGLRIFSTPSRPSHTFR